MLVKLWTHLCTELLHWVVNFVFSGVFVCEEAALTHMNIHTPQAAKPKTRSGLSQLNLVHPSSPFFLLSGDYLSPVMGVVLQVWQGTPCLIL